MSTKQWNKEAKIFKAIARKKSTMPILSRIFLDKDLNWCVSDLDITATSPKCGDLIGAFDLEQFLSLDRDQLRCPVITELGASLTDGIATIQGIGADEIPNVLEFSKYDYKRTATVQTKNLKLALEHSNKDETRFNQCGVNFVCNRIEATDNHRAYTAKLVFADMPMETSYILNNAAIKLILSATKGDRISFQFTESNYKYAKIDSDFCTITAKCINAEFPNMKDLMPNGNGNLVFTLEDKRTLADLVARTKHLKELCIPLGIMHGDKHAMATIRTIDSNGQRIDMSLPLSFNVPEDIGINLRYFVPILENFDSVTWCTLATEGVNVFWDSDSIYGSTSLIMPYKLEYGPTAEKRERARIAKDAKELRKELRGY